MQKAKENYDAITRRVEEFRKSIECGYGSISLGVVGIVTEPGSIGTAVRSRETRMATVKQLISVIIESAERNDLTDCELECTFDRNDDGSDGFQNRILHLTLSVELGSAMRDQVLYDKIVMGFAQAATITRSEGSCIEAVEGMPSPCTGAHRVSPGYTTIPIIGEVN